MTGSPSRKKKNSASAAIATNTGVPSTSATRIRIAIGQAKLANRSGASASANAAGIAASAITRPGARRDAAQAKRSAITPSAAGITSSSSHTGVPPSSVRPSSRFASTSPTAA